MEDFSQTPQSTFVTTDTHLAAALKTVGYPLLTTRRSGRIVEFIFEPSPDLDEDVRAYYNNSLNGNLFAMATETKLLKRMIYTV